MSEGPIEKTMAEGYTVIRVKRKVTEDPERGLQLTAKKVRLSARHWEWEGEIGQHGNSRNCCPISHSSSESFHGSFSMTHQNFNGLFNSERLTFPIWHLNMPEVCPLAVTPPKPLKLQKRQIESEMEAI